MKLPVRCLLATALLLLIAACSPPEPVGDATVPVGPEGLEGDL